MRYRGALALLAAATLHAAGASAQIVTDGSVGPAQILAGPNFVIAEALGQRANGNLFHSFDEFGLPAGSQATFTGGVDVERVIARVTGGQASDIDGRITVGIPGADFFFINPAGVHFGPGARMTLTGDAHFAAAADLRFDDGGVFSAADVAGSSLSVATPAAFGFLPTAPGPLTVNGSILSSFDATGVSLIGRDVDIQSASIGIRDNAGVVSIGAGGPGEPVRLDLSGDIPTEGAIAIRSGTFVFSEGDLRPDGAGVVRLRARTVAIDGQSFVTASTVNFFAQGRRGEVEIAANSLTVSGASVVDTFESFSPVLNPAAVDRTRGVSVTAREVTVRDEAFIGSSGGLLLPGSGGAVTVNANSVRLENGGQFRAQSNAAGNVGLSIGGVVTVNASVFEASGVGPNGFNAGIQAFGSSGAFGGDIVLNVDALGFSDNATLIANGQFGAISGNVAIDANTVSFASGARINLDGFVGGAGGSLVVNAQSIALTDADFNANIFAIPGFDLAGAGGSIILNAPEISLSGDANVFVGSLGFAEPGTVTINTTNLSLSGRSDIFTDAFSGVAGDVIVNAAGAVTLSDDAGLGANADSGDGGALIVNAATISLSDASQIAAASFGVGRGGAATLTANRIELGDRSRIATIAFAAGDAGDVSVTATELLSLTGGASIFASAEELTGVSPIFGPIGAGGDVTIVGGDIVLAGTDPNDPAMRPFITARSNSPRAGAAGGVSVTADDVTLSNGARISVEAETAAGGQVDLTADGLLLLRNAELSASVNAGGGDGGDVTVRALLLAVDADGTVIANADDGDGGFLRFFSLGTFIDPAATITANSRGGAPGVIEIEGVQVGLGDVGALDPGFFDPRLLLDDPCAAAASGRSRLYVDGAGGARIADEGAPGLFLDIVPYPSAQAGDAPASTPPATLAFAAPIGCGGAHVSLR